MGAGLLHFRFAGWLAFFFAARFAFLAFAHLLQAFFAAGSAFGRALDEFGTDQLELGRLGTVALADTKFHNAGIAAWTLVEPGTDF